MKEKIRYYGAYTDDFEVAPQQDMKLPDDYEYIRRDFFSGVKSAFIYGCAVVFGGLYIRLFLHTRYRNKKVLKGFEKQGIFLFGNHTQPVGDVFIPAIATLPKRIYTVASPANFSLPVIGRILPYLGALPLSDTPRGMKKFTEAVSKRIEEGKVVTVYPEAHVWEYCTEIRPFTEGAFRYPVKLSAPSFSMTVTYQKRRLSKKPKAVVYIDGPFYPDETLSPRKQAEELSERIRETMTERSKESNINYIEYIRKDECTEE